MLGSWKRAKLVTTVAGRLVPSLLKNRSLIGACAQHSGYFKIEIQTGGVRLSPTTRTAWVMEGDLATIAVAGSSEVLEGTQVRSSRLDLYGVH